MRLLSSMIVAWAAITAPDADQLSWLDQPRHGPLAVANPALSEPCDFWRTLEQVARQTGVRVGLENLDTCHSGGWGLSPGEGALDLSGLTLRMIFARVVEPRQEFAWTEIDGVVVVRPVEAWTSRENALHRTIMPFAVDKIHPHLALHAMLEAARPSMLHPHSDIQLSALGRRRFDPGATGLIDRPITIDFQGGSLLQALNAVTERFGGIWQVGYAGGFMRIDLQTRDLDEGSTGITVRLESNGSRQR
jgi:hypothetical protein